jgi:hypothetical protein
MAGRKKRGGSTRGAKARDATRRETKTEPATPLSDVKRILEDTLHRHAELRDGGPVEFAKAVEAEYRNIVGVAISHAQPRNGSVHAHDAAPGDEVLLVLLAEDRPLAEVRATIQRLLGRSAATRTPLPIDVVVTGAVRAHSQSMFLRPAAAGVSVGNCRTVSGSFGFLARGRTPPRDKQLFVVSNTHVLASGPVASPTDGICQPGPTDGGTCPAQQIARLERFVPINFGGPNHVDAAAAVVADHATVRPGIFFLRGGVPAFATIGPERPAAFVGMQLSKSGRSTGLTTGRVLSPAATVMATYGPRTALFQDQILVQGFGGDFSADGDSGSLVWTADPARNPVGLLFGGGRGVSFVNHLDAVLNALDVEIVG